MVTEIMILKRGRSLLRHLLLTGFLFVGIILSGATLIGASTEKKPRGPLTLRITLSDPSVCRGMSPLRVIAELKNVSGKQIVIAPGALSYSYSRTYCHDSGEFGECDTLVGGNGDGVRMRMGKTHAPQDSVVLEPAESYKRSYTLDFGKPGAVADLGSYTASVSYDQFYKVTFHGMKLFRGVITSNEIKIDVEECK
jgi:hypothetical protein